MSLDWYSETLTLRARNTELEAQTKEAWEHYDAILEDCGDSKDKRIKALEAQLDVVKEIAIDMDLEEDYWKERLFAALEKPE